jgi:hypothetical protein
VEFIIHPQRRIEPSHFAFQQLRQFVCNGFIHGHFATDSSFQIALDLTPQMHHFRLLFLKGVDQAPSSDGTQGVVESFLPLFLLALSRLQAYIEFFFLMGNFNMHREFEPIKLIKK